MLLYESETDCWKGEYFIQNFSQIMEIRLKLKIRKYKKINKTLLNNLIYLETLDRSSLILTLNQRS